MKAEEYYKALSDAVVDMDEDKAEELAKQAVESGFNNGEFDAYKAIEKGLAKGMERAGDLFEEEEYFVPELIICSDAMNRGIAVLKPHLKLESMGAKHRGVIGVIEGDTHDIGKNLVRIMLEAAGFELLDLGRDVPPATFVEKCVEFNAELILASSLMTTTMSGMKEIVRLLGEKGLDKKVKKVAIGGGPISQAFADKIGADGYAKNAAEAIRLCRKLVAA